MSAREKKPYEEQNAADKLRYAEEMSSYEVSESSEESPSSAPKKVRKPTARNEFSKQRRAALKREESSLTSQEMTKKIGLEWEALSSEERAEYAPTDPSPPKETPKKTPTKKKTPKKTPTKKESPKKESPKKKSPKKKSIVFTGARPRMTPEEVETDDQLDEEEELSPKETKKAFAQFKKDTDAALREDEPTLKAADRKLRIEEYWEDLDNVSRREYLN